MSSEPAAPAPDDDAPPASGSGAGRLVRPIVIAAVVVAAAIAVLAILRERSVHPRTTDAYVDANVVSIVPQVSGRIVELAVTDNQRVEAGDLLFQVDPRPFQIAVDAARAQLDQTSQNVSAQVDAVTSAEASLERAHAGLRLAQVQFKRVEPLAKQGALPAQDRDKAQAQLDEARSTVRRAEAQLSQARDQLGQTGEQNATARAAMAKLHDAELQLDYARVVSPVDGHVTQLRLSPGSFAQSGQPTLSLIDDDSWRVVAFMREDQLERVKPGQRVHVHLPAYPELDVIGVVQGIGRGIQRQEGASGADGLPSVSPTVAWVMLAQRFPVRITIPALEETHPLRRGMTATVRIDTDSGGEAMASGARP